MSELRLVDLFHHHFEVAEATTDELKLKAFRLRYQVYCVENSFEPKNLEGLERDIYDGHSLHGLLIHRASGNVAGGVRLVQSRPNDPLRSFPLQEFSDDPAFSDRRRFPLAHTAEVSRFAISRDFRRRFSDTAYGDNSPGRPLVMQHITLGLMRAIMEISRAHDITDWVAVMEPALLRLLQRVGIFYAPIGGLIEHHGLRQPCAANIEEMVATSREHNFDCYEVMTDSGRLAERRTLVAA